MVRSDFVPLCLMTMACLSCAPAVLAEAGRPRIAPVDGWRRLPVPDAGQTAARGRSPAFRSSAERAFVPPRSAGGKGVRFQ